MSFSSDAKRELCRDRLERRDAAVAESYGVLLYCHSFDAREVRIITASPDFAQRLPKLFKRAFSLSFDQLPPEGAAGKQSFAVTDPKKLALIFDAFDGAPSSQAAASPIPRSATTWSLPPLTRA